MITQQEARAVLTQGHRITHISFERHEFIRRDPQGILRDEEDNDLSEAEEFFWGDRTAEFFQTGWIDLDAEPKNDEEE